MLTVGELIEFLSDFDEDMEVRLAHQPGWPFEYDIKGVIDVALEVEGTGPGYHRDPNADEEVEIEESTEHKTVVYIVEGEQIGYLPTPVVMAAGWTRDR